MTHAAAIVSNGPSATRFPACHHYDLVIAVRGASALVAADWVIEMDGTGLQKLFRDKPGPPLGDPAFFVCHAALTWCRDNDRAVYNVLRSRYVLCWPEKHPDIPSSGLAAFTLLRRLGVDAAACYGYDMAGNSDCGGGTNGTREAPRWQRERALIAELAERWQLALDWI